jgi:hypothetical protein
MQPNSGRPPANVIVEVPSQIPLPQRLGEGGRDVRIPSANLFPRAGYLSTGYLSLAVYGLRRWREVGKIDLTKLAASRDPI